MPNQNLQDYFQKDLITELGLQDLPDDKKEQFVLKVGELIQQNIILRVLDELSDKDKDEFEQVLTDNNPEKILAFLQSKIPNLEELFKEEVAKFKQTAISRMQMINELIA